MSLVMFMSADRQRNRRPSEVSPGEASIKDRRVVHPKGAER